jgi:hypothetical protein
MTNRMVKMEGALGREQTECPVRQVFCISLHGLEPIRLGKAARDLFKKLG